MAAATPTHSRRRSRGTGTRARHAAGLEDRALTGYLEQLDRYPMLGPEQERALARRIDRLEIHRWRALLAQPGAPAMVAAAVAPLSPPQAHSLPALDELVALEHATEVHRESAPRAALVAAAARQLRAADAGHLGLPAAEARVSEAFSGDRAADAYLARLGRVRAAHERAKHAFVTANLRLVIAMARRYKQRALPLIDLIQEGNVGLMRAVERFDHRRGLRFSTYAGFWIRHSLNRALSDKSRLVRVPVRMLGTILRVDQRSAANGATGPAAAIEAELAREAGLSNRALALVRAHLAARDPISLDRTSDSENDQTLHDVLASEDFPDPEAHCEVADGLRALDRSLEALSPFEAEVLSLRFGLADGTELTLRQVGERCGLSRERIRQVQDTALAKLRDMIESGPAAPAARKAA